MIYRNKADNYIVQIAQELPTIPNLPIIPRAQLAL